MMKRIAAAAVLLGVFAAFGATISTTEKSAGSIKANQTVTLKWSEEEGAYIGYLKATLARQRAYSVYTSGVTTNMDLSISVYPKEKDSDDAKEPQAEFEEIEAAGDDIYQVMYADSWYVDTEDPSESDPKSWVYYFEFTAAYAATFNVHFASSIVLPSGIAENPRQISPAAATNTVSAALQTGGEYFFRAKLSEGVLYSFSTAGGSEESGVSLSIDIAPEEDDGDDDDDDDDDSPVWEEYANPWFVDDPCNEGIYVVPETSGYYIITVSGDNIETNESESASSEIENFQFSFKHNRFAQLAPSAHALAGELEPGVETECVPGFLFNLGANGAYDDVIDESLYSFAAVKGGRYAAETAGAAVPLLMRIYDAKGDVLCENGTIDGLSYDVRCAFEAPASGTYYLGVCEDLELPFEDAPAYLPCTLAFEKISAGDGDPDKYDAADDTAAGATPLDVAAGDASSSVLFEGAESDVHRLSKTDWVDVFSIAGRKGFTYIIGAEFADDSDVSPFPLEFTVFTLSGTSEREVAEGEVSPGVQGTFLSFSAAANATYYVRVNVAGTYGLDYPGYRLRALGFSESGSSARMLKVNLYGTPLATFSLGTESVKYPGGSCVLVSGSAAKQRVKFNAVTGFATPAAVDVELVDAPETAVVEKYYSDTFDSRDDSAKGATAWTLKNTETSMSRTLWADDPEDNFAIAGGDGYYYDFALEGATGDAVFSITNAVYGSIVEDEKKVSLVNLPKTAAKYYLTVKHADASAPEGGRYAITGSFKNVGAVKFARTAVSVRENASTASVQVNRTAKDGIVRVRYSTVDGTAKAGENYVSQSGVLEWPANNNAAKTITVKLVPDLVEHYTGNRTFDIVLEPLSAEELSDGEYPAAIAGGDTCTVTVTEISRAGTTIESVYAAKAPKLAKVATENVALETGSFTGILEERDGALTNGLPQLASLTFTASTANPAALSAKVLIAGKTYSFSARGWDEDQGDGFARKTFSLVQKVAGVAYTNILEIAVRKGSTAAEGDWLAAGGQATLAMNVPDSNSKGVQENIVYTGPLGRNNAKIQDYLEAVTNFTGYYTIALVPEGVTAADGIPYGEGYLTLTVDNKGTVKVAGMLADGTSRPSLSVAGAKIEEDASSDNGYAMTVPVYFARNPVLFGGRLRLYKNAEAGAVVADSSLRLVWNNDSPAVRYDGSEGYSISLAPSGGWYDTLINLERYYLGSPLSVSTPSTSAFPKEMLASGYDFVSGIEADGMPVAVAGNVFSTDRRVLVKKGALNDLEASVNPMNVQVKLARATGLVSGTFSVWSGNAAGTAYREIAGFKHNGVLILSQDPASALEAETVTSGFAYKAVPLTDYNESTRRTTRRNWMYSMPFRVVK